MLNSAKDIHHMETGNLKSQQERTEDRRLISGLWWSKWTHRGKQLCAVRRRWEIHRVLQPNVVITQSWNNKHQGTKIWSDNNYNTTKGAKEVTRRGPSISSLPEVDHPGSCCNPWAQPWHLLLVITHRWRVGQCWALRIWASLLSSGLDNLIRASSITYDHSPAIKS